MKIAKLSLAFFLFLQLSAHAAFAQNVGRLFTVNDAGDTADASPGDGVCADAAGKCTLRAAVDEANGNAAERDVIIFSLAYPAVIELTNGELALTGNNTSIVGPGARRLTIRRAAAAAIPSRIFHIPNSGTNAVIRGITISGGNAGQLVSGGAIRIAAGGSLSLAEVVISGNSAGNGGGIANDGTLSVSRSLFTGNTANASGGALSLANGSSTRITNSTFTGNSGINGGAIHAEGSLLSVNNTIAGNTAGVEASSVFAGNFASATFLNTIIGPDTSLPVTTLRGTFTTLGNNFVTDARNSNGFTNSANGDQVGDNNAIDPLLGPLTDNGGQTDTRELLAGSPAINAGNSCVYDGNCAGISGAPLRLFWDQRVGRIRRGLNTAVDVGAFESGNTTVSISSFGIFPPNPGPHNSGAFAVLINVRNGEMQFAKLNILGRYRFRSHLATEVYVLDLRRKRGPRTAPQVIAFEF